MNLWFLSFVDETLPKGSRFLGASIVEGEDIEEARDKADEEGCNPGGEIAGWIMIPSAAAKVPSYYRNRLMQADEIHNLEEIVNEPFTKSREDASVICADCNDRSVKH